MTSVLYSAGLNYQAGNPVRQEIVGVRREVDSLRKQIESLTEENLVYRKYIMKMIAKEEINQTEFTRDLMSLVSPGASGGAGADSRTPGGGTVQGGGFRR
jgi:hypothetical protein